MVHVNHVDNSCYSNLILYGMPNRLITSILTSQLLLPLVNLLILPMLHRITSTTEKSRTRNDSESGESWTCLTQRGLSLIRLPQTARSNSHQTRSYLCLLTLLTQQIRVIHIVLLKQLWVTLLSRRLCWKSGKPLSLTPPIIWMAARSTPPTLCSSHSTTWRRQRLNQWSRSFRKNFLSFFVSYLQLWCLHLWGVMQTTSRGSCRGLRWFIRWWCLPETTNCHVCSVWWPCASMTKWLTKR